MLENVKFVQNTTMSIYKFRSLVSRGFKFLFLTLVFSMSHKVFSQAPITAYVKSSIINVRFGPGVEFDTLCTLPLGTKIEIFGASEMDSKGSRWYPIEFKNRNGDYMLQGFVIGKYIEIKYFEGWSPTASYTGGVPDCLNILPKFDYSINSKLQINMTGNTDCVVKLYNQMNVCVRIAYLKSGEEFAMQYIPEGLYHVKIAYGNDLRKKNYGGNCYVKFMQNAQYKSGDEILNYNVVHSKKYEYGKTYDVTSIPSYILSLSVQTVTGNEFSTDQISEVEFNK
jgi:hypothetical protein